MVCMLYCNIDTVRLLPTVVVRCLNCPSLSNLGLYDLWAVFSH